MTPISVSPATTVDFVVAPRTLHDVITQAADQYPLHELSFITSSAHDSSIRTKTFSMFNQYVRSLAQAMLEWGKPIGSIIVVYLTEDEDNMAAVWACLLAGYLPCLQPALSAQNIAHIKKLFRSVTWLTSELGAEQITIFGVEVHLLSELKSSAKNFVVAADWVAYEAKPDDDAIMFLTSGSTEFSKAVVHTHRTILAACRAQGQNFGMTSGSKVLNWVGFDHVAGLLEFHITPLLYGASQLHVHASVIITGPVRLLRLIDEKSIQLAFGPNFLLSKLTCELKKRSDLFGCFDLSSIKRINSGGEVNVSKTARAFVTMMKKFSKNPSAVSFVIAPGFRMTETRTGCIYNYPLDVLTTAHAREFLDLGCPINSCEMRIVDPADGATLRPDSESGELQIRWPMVFVCYNNTEATSSSFLEGGWFRTGDAGIIENGVIRLGGRIKDTIIIYGVSYGISELEIHLQTVEGVMHSFLAAAPYRTLGQETEGFVIFYSPTFDLDGADASAELFATHRALRDICVKMITLPPQYIIPIPVNQMEKTTLGKISRARLMNQFKQGQLAKHIARSEELLSEARGSTFIAPSTETEKIFVKIYADIFDLVESEVSVGDNFFGIGGTSLDAIRLKREGEEYFGLPDISAIQILKHPVLESLAHYGTKIEEYDPIVPLSVTGSKTPIFFVHPGVGEVLIFINLAKYFQNERPFYAFRARGFEPGHPFFTSMDEMVSCYTSAARRVQVKGPYAIAGYGYSGAVAFEIAKRLEGMGEEVKFLAPINIPPNISGRMRELDWTAGLLNLSAFLGFMSRFDIEDLHPSVSLLTKQEQLDFVWNLAPPERIAELHLTLEKLDKWTDVAMSLINCGIDYTPTGSVAVVDVFYTTPFAGLKLWTGFSRDKVSYTLVPGEHTTLMDFEYVPQFQKIFRSRLEACGL